MYLYNSIIIKNIGRSRTTAATPSRGWCLITPDVPCASPIDPNDLFLLLLLFIFNFTSYSCLGINIRLVLVYVLEYDRYVHLCYCFRRSLMVH